MESNGNSKRSHKIKLSRIIYTILSFIFSILMALTSILAVVGITVLNEDFFRNQIEKSGYANYILTDIHDKLAAYGSVSGFDRDFFVASVSLDTVKSDIYREVSRLFSRSKKTIDTTGFKESLTEKLYENVAQRGIELTEEGDAAINYLATMSASVYTETLSIPFSDQIYGLIVKLKRLNEFALAAIIFLDILCIVMLLFSNVSRRRKSEYFLNAFNGTLLLLLAPILILSFNDISTRLAISSRAIYFFIQTYVSALISACWLTIAIVFVLSLAILIFNINVRRSRTT